MTESERRRLKFLLLAVAAGLEDGRSPQHGAFRVEPNVGIDECARFGEAIAFGIPYWMADAFGEES
jgi:hypothetical protein